MNKIFNPLLDKAVEVCLKIKRIHWIRKPQNIATDLPRDVLVRFQLYEEKAQIWGEMRRRPPLKYEGVDLQLFTDLAPETLARWRLFKPLLEQILIKNIKYSWGFLVSLIGQKDRRSTKLRSPEDLQEFCNKLDLQAKVIPGWTEEEILTQKKEEQWQKLHRVARKT